MNINKVLKKDRKGFTLTELIVVIVIIGILAAVLIPTLTGYIKKANKSADEQEVATLNKLLLEAKIENVEFSSAADLKEYLKNEMDYNGDYSLRNKNSYIWFDTKEYEFVILGEEDNSSLKLMAVQDNFDLVAGSKMKSPEGLMQYSDGSEVWLIGGNGNLVKLVSEIRQIGNTGADLTEYSKLSNDHKIREIFAEFFEAYVFNGDAGTFEVDANGNVTEYISNGVDDKKVIYSNDSSELLMKFHKEVILKNILAINESLKDSPVRLEVDENKFEVKVIITDKGLIEAAPAVLQVVNILKEQGCNIGYVFPKYCENLDNYIDLLITIKDAANDYKVGEKNSISEIVYESMLDIDDLSKLYKVDLSLIDTENLNISQLMSDVLPQIAYSLNIYYNETDMQYDLINSELISSKAFENSNDITLVGIIKDNPIYGNITVNYDFNFIVEK